MEFKTLTQAAHRIQKRLSFQTLNSKRAKDDGGQILSFIFAYWSYLRNGMLAWEILIVSKKMGSIHAF